MLIITVNQEVRRKLLHKLVADIHLRASRVRNRVMTDPVRVKKEGGTFTLGIPVDVLCDIVSDIAAEEFQIGGRITPQLNGIAPLAPITDLVAAVSAVRREGTPAATDNAPSTAVPTPSVAPRSYLYALKGGGT